MDIYAETTNRIIARLEQGDIPWRKPWCGTDLACNHISGNAYSLVNQFLVGEAGEYVTYKQATTAGGHVKHGARGKFVVFWKVVPRGKDTDDDEKGEHTRQKTITVLRYYYVFNISTDCEGLTPKHQGKLHEFEPAAEAERIMSAYVAREGIKLDHIAQGRSYYSPASAASDRVVLPVRVQFESAAGYYSTAFHELIHSTGHPNRLNRYKTDGQMQFGGENYSKEELVAEIGSASILHALGLETDDTFDNTAAYIQNWIKALKDDKRLIVSAASRAEKAVERVMGNDAS